MRAFLLACLAVVVVGAGGYFTLASLQQPSGIAFATDAARINPQWTWRSIFAKSTQPPQSGSATVPPAPRELVEACDPRTATQWIFLDLGRPDGESRLCSFSQ
jgi:hypothetical protein